MAVEPLVAIVFIVAPWIFGFADVGEAKTISIVIGLVMLATGMLTRWRMALLKVIPLGIHRAIDLVLGATAIASPYILGFSDIGSAARFLLIVGIIELDFTVLTRWTTE